MPNQSAMFHRCILVPVLTVAACVLAQGTRCAADEVSPRAEVVLRDGRTVTGLVDWKSDRDRLWLSIEDGGVTLRSGFDWERVDHVVYESKQRTPAEFRELVASMTLPKPEVLVIEQPAENPITPLHTCANCERELVPASYEAPPSVMRSLTVRARAANWDADPEADGLLVEVIPRGDYGELVPVDGQITMVLIGEYSQIGALDLRRFRPRYPEIARLTETVRKEDFLGGPAVYKLPYRTLFPESHLDVFPQGVLTATLGVSSQGAFHASDDAIALIPASPIRDRRQQVFGSRYFPQEAARRNP